MTFAGRTAIITGSARGIGEAIAERLAAGGVCVAIVDIDQAAAETQAERITASGGEAFAVPVDVTSSESVNRMVGAVLERRGRIDILVNNAGIGGRIASTVDYTVEEWRRVLDIDLNGVFYCTKAVLPHMIQAGYGRIVNIASIAGKEGNPNQPAYAAAKAGVIGFTKAMAKGVATKGILANVVTPGSIGDTNINDVYTSQDLELFRSFVPRIPMEREAKPREVAALAAWLCSEECSYSTGAVFDISGGRASY